MVSLLDVNLLIALAWPTHIHHRVALDWFRENQALGWATCPLTQSGFVRVSANEKALPDAKTLQEAVSLLRQIVAHSNHQFWEDDVSLATSQHFDVTRLTGYRQVTDAHLVTLALHRGGRLATLERKIQALVPRGHQARDVVCAILEK
jgi:toxin-antitoxin system PIN domain toxin